MKSLFGIIFITIGFAFCNTPEPATNPPTTTTDTGVTSTPDTTLNQRDSVVRRSDTLGVR